MIADVIVRLATPLDAPDIARMSRDYIERGLPWRWRTGRIEATIARSDCNVAVVGDRGTVTAFGIMSYADEDARLLLFAVRPEVRRTGVGSAVLGWLEAVARTAGSERILVEARRDNVAARNFYCEHGYHECQIAKAMYGVKTDGICLQKLLRSGTS